MIVRIAALAVVAALVLGTGAAEAQDPEPLPESPFKERLVEEPSADPSAMPLEKRQKLQIDILRLLNEARQERVAELEAENAELQGRVAHLARQLAEAITDLETGKPKYAPWALDDDDDYERFQLWTGCQPLALTVLVDDTTERGARLAEESVRSAAESRLRAARLYSDLSASGVVLILAERFGERGIFRISVRLNKVRFDLATGLRSPSTAWKRGSFGVGTPDYVRSALAELMDVFLADYLRVNDESCG